MSANELVLILQFSATIVVGLVLVFRSWPGHRLDRFRQEMFSLRDEVFDYAAEGNIAFDHQAYRLLRQSMNGYLRYAHRLTIGQLLLTAAAWKVAGGEPELRWSRKWQAAVESINNRAEREALLAFHARAMLLVVKRVTLGSFSSILVALVALLGVAAHEGWHGLRGKMGQASSKLFASIVDPRLVDEEAANLAIG